jgi:hypothetical protein
VTRLNVESGRKDITNIYSLNAAEITYLPLGSPAQFSDIFVKTEEKLPDNGTTPTRAQFLILSNLFDRINNTGS